MPIYAFMAPYWAGGISAGGYAVYCIVI